MLVLTRRPGEWVRITLPDGTQVKVVITAVDRNEVRVGFEADRSVRVDREEVAVIKDAERKNAHK